MKDMISLVLVSTILAFSSVVFAGNPYAPPSDANEQPFPVPSLSDPITGSCMGLTGVKYQQCYIDKVAIPGCMEFLHYKKIPAGSCNSRIISAQLSVERSEVNLCRFQARLCTPDLEKKIDSSNPNFSCDSLNKSCLYSNWYYYNL